MNVFSLSLSPISLQKSSFLDFFTLNPFLNYSKIFFSNLFQRNFCWKLPQITKHKNLTWGIKPSDIVQNLTIQPQESVILTPSFQPLKENFTSWAPNNLKSTVQILCYLVFSLLCFSTRYRYCYWIYFLDPFSKSFLTGLEWDLKSHVTLSCFICWNSIVRTLSGA